MTRNNAVAGVLLFLLSVVGPTGIGHGAERTPEQFVRDFYAWYFQADRGKTAAIDKEAIREYVAESRLKALRNPCNLTNEDYFAKANIFAAQWLDAEIMVSPAVALDRDIFVVPVEFGLEGGSAHVVVVLKRENGALRITRVFDIYPYS